VIVAYAVDRFGDLSHTGVLENLVRGMDEATLRDAIGEYGLEAVATQLLRTLIDDGTLHADAADAHSKADGILDSDAEAAPRVHPVTVADLADLFTRLDLTDPP
jgi:hypothetical protein